MKKIVKNVVWLLMLLAASATAQAQPAKGNTPCAESMATPLSEEGKLGAKVSTSLPTAWVNHASVELSGTLRM